MRVRRLALALHAVSTSPAMPKWPEYVERVEAMRPELRRLNAREPALVRGLVRVAETRAATLDAQVCATDLVTALSSFVDDYAVAPPTELFAIARSRRVLEAMRGACSLTVHEQLDLALRAGEAHLLDAVLALHTATRALARGRDGRLHPELAFSLDERLARGRAIAPFHPDDARGGDPLGDTYHFWANVAAGLYAGSGRRRDLRRHCVGALLFAGPLLMRGIREGVFDNRLFYGNHERVDRLGLRAGYALARG